MAAGQLPSSRHPPAAVRPVSTVPVLRWSRLPSANVGARHQPEGKSPNIGAGFESAFLLPVSTTAADSYVDGRRRRLQVV
ncbi:hypothetical protein XA68_10653 [Ophiocordyceps unilateralis]|uniref:Uncharacterized protein n=1 Tax=Ophiocordyceps unilateralis TaxID=268505 RepID=A0A2A9P2L7_OPHUN|nr:hypothetical protein XA68_10653 [Ophiocordyceps unilateralis]